MKNKELKFVKFLPCLIRWSTIALVALRACDVVSWPWYVVLSPLFVYAAWLILCAAICGVAAVKNKL